VKFIGIIAGLLSIVLVYGCNSVPTGTEDEQGILLSAQEKALVQASNDFGWELFRTLERNTQHQDLFISPFSVSMALGMTLNGARSATRDSIRSTLGFGGLSQTEINTIYRDLFKLLSTRDQDVLLEIANSIWTRTGFPVLQSFYEVNVDYFDAEVRELNFSDPAAVDIINSWIYNKTHGKIDEVLKNINNSAVMFLINATYFNGIWETEFDEENTAESVFYPTPGSPIPCQMMTKHDSLPYTETNRFQAVDLPYGEGDFRMTILLPREGESIHSLIADLNSSQWDLWINGFKEQPITLYLPKFELAYKETLNTALNSQGMGIAFDPNRADFTGITGDGGIWISTVSHETYLQVHEKGTEAAAVTVVELFRDGSGGVGKVIRINRPFLLAIRERSSGTILFVGKIMRPSWKE